MRSRHFESGMEFWWLRWQQQQEQQLSASWPDNRWQLSPSKSWSSCSATKYFSSQFLFEIRWFLFWILVRRSIYLFGRCLISDMIGTWLAICKNPQEASCLLSDASCGLIRVRKISFLHPACTAPTCWLTGQCPSVQPTGEKGEKPDQAESGSQTHFQERQGWAWKGTWLTMEPSWWVGNSRKFLS